MRNIIIKFKEGAMIWIWFLTVMVVWIYAYEYNWYYDIEEENNWSVLSSESYNKLLSNVREMRNDIISMSWALDNIADIVNSAKKLSDSTVGGTLSLIDGTSWKIENTYYYSDELSIEKWIYVVIVHNNKFWYDLNLNTQLPLNVTWEWDGVNFQHIYMSPVAGNPIEMTTVMRIRKDTKIKFKFTVHEEWVASVVNEIPYYNSWLFIRWVKIAD